MGCGRSCGVITEESSRPCNFGRESLKPRPQPSGAVELFQAHFDQVLNPDHELVQLAKQIDWPRFDAAVTDSYTEDLGAPGKATRLMAGLQYLKYAFDESDESIVARWVQNSYWQYFCG